jgi:hypothetical protein
MLLPGSVAAVITLALHVTAVIEGREEYLARRASRRLKRRLLRPRQSSPPKRTQCSQPVYDRLSLGPPERCAFEEGHEGRCEP